MKKSIFAVLIIAMLLLLAQAGFAQDTTNKFGIGAEVSFLKIFDYDVDNAVGTEQSFDGTAMPGLNLTYYYNQYFSTEFTVAYSVSDMEVEAAGLSLEQGELEQIPLVLTFRAHMPMESSLSPYIGAGLTYYINEFEMSGILKQVNPPSTTVEPDNGLGFHVSLGTEIFATENLAFDLDAKYTWYTEDFEVSAPSMAGHDEKIDLNSLTIGVGLKYYF